MRCVAVLRHYHCKHTDNKNSYSIFIGLIVCVLLAVGVWFFAPKGENQTCASLLITSSQFIPAFSNRLAVSGVAPESLPLPPATLCGVCRPHTPPTNHSSHTDALVHTSNLRHSYHLPRTITPSHRAAPQRSQSRYGALDDAKDELA